MNSLRHKKHGSKDAETKNSWCNRLISYISKIVKVVGGVKNKIMNLFKRHTTKNYSKPRKSKKIKNIKKQSEDNIIKAIKERITRRIRNSFEQEEDHHKPVGMSNF